MPKLDGITVTDEVLDAHDRVTAMDPLEFRERCEAIGLPIANYKTRTRWSLRHWPDPDEEMDDGP